MEIHIHPRGIGLRITTRSVRAENRQGHKARNTLTDEPESVEHNNGGVWVTSEEDGVVYVIDVANNKLVKTIMVGPRPSLTPAAVDQESAQEKGPYMERFLHRYSEGAYLVLRLGVAFLFVFHAPQKWLGWYGGPQWPLWSLRSGASLIEAIASPLIAIGLFTSFAAALGAAEMIGAYLVVHIHILPRAGWPIENRGELAILYFFVFLYIVARGGGRYSLDHWLRHIDGSQVETHQADASSTVPSLSKISDRASVP